jgi:hypothetical protein
VVPVLGEARAEEITRACWGLAAIGKVGELTRLCASRCQRVAREAGSPWLARKPGF